MAAGATRTEHVFLLRTWEEKGSDGTTQWRARIQHVQTGERVYFTSYDALQRFIERWRQ